MTVEKDRGPSRVADLSEDQRLLQDSLAKLLKDKYGFEQRKAYIKAGGWSREVWAAYAELGLLGMPFAEEDGGLAASRDPRILEQRPEQHGEVGHERGDLAGAEACLRAPTGADDIESVAQSATRAIRLTERGRLEEGARVIDAAEPLARRVFARQQGAWWSVGRMTVAAHRGDRAAVEDAVARLLDAVDWPMAALRGTAAEAYVLAAGGTVALEVLEPLLTVDEPDPAQASRSARAWYEHARAIRAERSGDPVMAAERYAQALGHEVLQPAWALADAEQGLARCLAATGRRQEALACATRAVERLERWPGWRRDAAEALHRRLAGGGDGPAGLTPRELEVLTLVAEGCSNREIAERLFIAVKTVAVRVSNILGKTGTSSRTEAAAWARRVGVLDEREAAGQP